MEKGKETGRCPQAERRQDSGPVQPGSVSDREEVAMRKLSFLAQAYAEAEENERRRSEKEKQKAREEPGAENPCR